MRRTYSKNFFRTVKDTFGRFAAIFAIVALGVGFLAGLLSSTPDMRYSFDRYFDDNSMYDIRVMGTLGLTDSDVSAIRKLDGVETVQPGYIADVLLTTGKDADFTARLHSVDTGNSSQLNKAELTSGRFPGSADECVAVNVPFSSNSKIKIGDTLSISENDKNADDLLSSNKFTVVGFVDYCPYFSIEKEYTNIGSGTVDVFLLVPEDSFKTDFYTDVYITAKDAADLTCLTDEYKSLVDGAADNIKNIADERSQIRYDEVVNEAQDELADAKADYDKAKADADEQLSDAAEKLADGRQEIADGGKQLADAKEQIEENEQKLEDSEKELDGKENDAASQFDDAEKQISDAQSELDENRGTADKTISDGEAELQSYGLSEKQQAAFDAIRTLPASNPSLTEALQSLQTKSDRLKEIAARLTEIAAMSPGEQAKYADEAAGLQAESNALQSDISNITSGDDYKTFYQSAAALVMTGAPSELSSLAVKLGAADAAITQLDAAQAGLDSKKAELASQKASAEKEISDARAQIENGKKELAEAKETYASQLGKLSDAKATLAENEQKYEDAKAEADTSLADGAQKISDAEKAISDIELPSWSVYTRENNTSYASISANIDKVNAIAKIFPFFFFIVAALVALTTMTRMVEDERLQIGTMKALGYSRGDIMMKYILYALSASVLGSVFGIVTGLRLFPSVIWNAYTMMYELPRFYYPVNWLFVFATSGAAVLCTLLATINACRATLREKPAQLMLVKAPEPGKRVLLERITPIWKRMNFTHKVTARNLFRYKKRFLMTTIGVAGCTALLMAGFGLHDSFHDIAERQFDILQTFDIMAPYAKEADVSNTELRSLLDDGGRISGSTTVSYESIDASKGGRSLEIYTFIPENASDLDGFVCLRERHGAKPIAFGEGSVVITEKASEVLKVKQGDELTLTSKDGVTGTFTVSGICENYLRNYIYMTEETYESVMGRSARQNLLLIRLTENGLAAKSDVGRSLLDTGALSGLSYTSDSKDAFSTALDKIDTIVFVVILSAGALAFVVLYNLTNINISERVKEIATIKVLGFTDHEVNAYINRESVILSLIGTAFGLVLGIFLHRYVVASAEMNTIMFGRTIKFMSYVYSAVLTMVFSILVDLIMQRKLRRVSMVESMKAPE